jgi:hypothetical protein
MVIDGEEWEAEGWKVEGYKLKDLLYASMPQSSAHHHADRVLTCLHQALRRCQAALYFFLAAEA